VHGVQARLLAMMVDSVQQFNGRVVSEWKCPVVTRTLLNLWPGTVVHTCKPSYWGGREWEDHSLSPAQAKS
jgi:hypothetical protein